MAETFSGDWRSGSGAAATKAQVRPSLEKIVSAKGREREQCEPGQRAPEQLQPERRAEEPAQAPPLLRRGVAEAVLRQRLLDGQVEQDLEEPRRDEDGREEAEVLDRERSCRHDRAEHSESGGAIEAGGGRKTAQKKPRAHLGAPV